MDVGESGQPRQLLIEPGVVLHRAGAQRVEPAVDCIVLLRQPREVTYHLRLAQAGQSDRPPPLQPAKARLERSGLSQIDTTATW